MSEGHVKRCIHCGEDCSSRPRIKDPQGRYACKACVEARAAAASSSAASGASGDDAYVIMDLEEPKVKGMVQSAQQPCGSCGVLMNPEAVICTSCGWSPATGRAVKTRLGVAQAPDTHSADPHKAKRQRERAEQDARAVRNQVLVPAIIVPVGIGLCAVTLGAKQDAQIAFIAGFTLGMSVISTAMYLLCCILWMGLNTGLAVTALQMAASVAVGLATAAIMQRVPAAGLGSLVFSVVIPSLACAFTMKRLMDLDIEDALLATAISFSLPLIVVPIVLLAIQ